MGRYMQLSVLGNGLGSLSSLLCSGLRLHSVSHTQYIQGGNAQALVVKHVWIPVSDPSAQQGSVLGGHACAHLCSYPQTSTHVFVLLLCSHFVFQACE